MLAFDWLEQTVKFERIPVENRYSAAPNLKMYMIQESDRSMQVWLYEYHYMFIVQGSAIIAPPCSALRLTSRK